MASDTAAVTGEAGAGEPTRWTPGPDVKLHSGEPLPAEMEFFAAPPAEIGPVISGHSTLKSGRIELSYVSAWALRIGVTLACVFAGQYLGRWIDGGAGQWYVWGIPTITGLVGFIAVVALTVFEHTATFVGEAGLARLKLSGSRTATPKVETQLFSQSSQMRNSETRNYNNGIYTGTNYSYVWHDLEGKPRFTVSGDYYSQKGTPKPVHAYWFARRAQAAWNAHVSERMQQQLDAAGFVEFPVNKKDVVRVGPGFLELFFGGQTTRLTQADIKSVSINNGWFYLTTHDAKWFSSKGKFSFAYGEISNAQMFLICLEKLMGYSFE